jgi:Domain of unknown function (DUF4136)
MNFPAGAATMRLASILASAIVLCGCATTPNIRANYDHSANFAGYHTYGFPAETGTDRAGYSTLITGHFKRAVGREMEARGYRFDADKPELLVNFFASSTERTDVQSTPRLSIGAGYYSYRLGLYTEWPLYGRDVATDHHTVGTASIDVVDAARKQLVWEGRAEGRLTDKMLDDPGPAVDKAVADIFTKYPVVKAAH